MKAEYVLKWSVAALGHLKQGANGNASDILKMLQEEAEAEIRRKEAKYGGKFNRTKAAARVIKSAKASHPFRECFHGAWNDSAGRQCICDGFQAYRLREPLPLEKIPENESPLDLDRIVTPNQGESLNLPDIAELRAYIKTEKARLKASEQPPIPIYDFGDGLPALNAEYLLTALELLPGCTATASKLRPLLNCVYFESDAGDGCICPIRKAATV